MSATSILDAALDRSILLGYSKIGSALRRKWWAADPEAGSLRGKRVLVTGATSGIGEAMVESFAALGATVHVLGRNEVKTRNVAERLRNSHPHVEVVEELCDISDLDAVNAWCTGFLGRVPMLHGLVHNAGVMTKERQESKQGNEMALAAHVLGPHLMVDRLLPILENAEESTVVFMSSGGMYGAKLRTEDLQFAQGEYDGVQGYARTKRMQVVLAEAWSKRLRGTGTRVESMHPGWVGTPGVADSLPTFNKVLGRVLRDSEDGADTAVWLVATRPDSDGSHHFWHDRALRPTTVGWQRDKDAPKTPDLLRQVTALTGTEWPT